MNEISCEICMDLMPLVHDGVASADSVAAVQQHLARCPACSALYEGQLPAPGRKEQLMKKLVSQLRIWGAMALMFGTLFGLSLTAGSGLFYNVLIMPMIGAVGYGLFRWRGLYIIPALLLISHVFTNAAGLGGEYLPLPSLLMWTGLYCLFAAAGFFIAALLHFALKKEDSK